jgi:hypothetical protein
MKQPTGLQRGPNISGKFAILLLSALLLGALPAAAQSDVTGFWVLSVPTGDGNFMKSYFDLKQAGDQVTGTAWIRGRKLTVSVGSYKEGKLHFVVALRPNDPNGPVVYDGTLEDGKLALKIHRANRPVSLGTGERGTPDAMAPPARPASA